MNNGPCNNNKQPTDATRQHTQTVRIDGQRMRLTTRNGKVTARPVGEVEWKLQAAAARRLRTIEGILFAAGMESGKRGPRAQVQALATGLAAGHPDMTILLPEGRVMFIEYKTATGRLSPVQIERHAAMRELGHDVEVVKASTEQECADETERLVRIRLCANDNNSAHRQLSHLK